MFRDKDGYHWLTGRVDDVINVRYFLDSVRFSLIGSVNENIILDLKAAVYLMNIAILFWCWLVHSCTIFG